MSALGFQEILIIFFLVLIIIGICLIPFIFFLIELQNTLKVVKNENRKMKPGQVWLLLIPLFSIYWYFEVVGKIADSLQAEFKERNIQVGEEKPGYSFGRVICILGVVSFLIFIIPRLLLLATGPSNLGNIQLSALILFFNFIIGIANLVFFIMYWVKINGYRNKLIEAKRAA
jgi:hypothetical protein